MKKALLALILSALPAAAQTPAADLYSIELIPTPDLQRFSGIAELRPVASPFTAPVTPAGVHRYDVVITVDSLPDPRSLGNYRAYLVWAAPPSLRPMIKLGELNAQHRTQTVGEVAFNRFTIFISAESNANVRQPAGPFVMRGLSPSMRMGGAHVVQARAPAAEVTAGHRQLIKVGAEWRDHGWFLELARAERDRTHPRIGI